MTQISWAVLSGVLVIVLGQIVLKSLIEPRQRVREAISQVAYVLLKYQTSYAGPGAETRERQDEAASAARGAMAELSASAVLIPYYDTLHRFLGLPSKADLLEAEKQLWGLSNAVHGGGPAPASSLEMRNRTKIIQTKLGFKLRDS